MFELQLFYELRHLIYAIANTILSDEEQAESVALEVLLHMMRHRYILHRSECPCALLVAAITKNKAFRLYSFIHADGKPPQAQNEWNYLCALSVQPSIAANGTYGLKGVSLDLLLLGGAGDMALSDIAEILEWPDEWVAKRFLQDKSKLKKQTDHQVSYAVSRLRGLLLSMFQNSIPAHRYSLQFYGAAITEIAAIWAKQLVKLWHSFGAGLCSLGNMLNEQAANHRKRTAGILALLLACICVIDGAMLRHVDTNFSTYTSRSWHGIFQVMNHPSRQLVLPEEEAGVTLSALLYELNDLPDGFRRTEHILSDRSAHTYYQSEAGDRILFSQEVATQEVTGLNTVGNQVELLEMHGNTIAFQSANGLQRVYWFNGQYCYTLITTLPREEALRLAEAAAIKARPSFVLQRIPLESVPEQYTPRLARESGDVLLHADAPPEHIQVLHDFVRSCTEQQDAAVRITSFMPDGHASIADLQMLDGRLYYTLDTHRLKDTDKHATQQMRQLGQEFGQVELRTNGIQMALVVIGLDGQELEVVRYTT